MAEPNEQEQIAPRPVGREMRVKLLATLLEEQLECIAKLEQQVAELQQQFARAQGGVRSDG